METFRAHPFDEFRLGRTRTAWVAFVITVLVHLLLIFALPEQLLPVPEEATRSEPVTYEINLVDPEQMRYVEANPAVPENVPDRSDQYSFRDQQAADEDPLEADDSDFPAVDGEEDSMKIVEQPMPQPEAEPIEPGIYSTEAQPGEDEGAAGDMGDADSPPAVATAEPLPPPDFIQQEPETEEGPGSQIADTGPADEVFEEPDPEAPINVYRPPVELPTELEAGDGSGGAAEARPMPRERPRLDPDLVSGPLRQSDSSARRRGEVAIDATFSEFGEYEQQFYAAIQSGWYQEIEFFQPMDTAARVHVRFRIQADGTVDHVEAVQSTASQVATVICVNAITKRSPFRPWTEEMVQVFGSERWLNVVFHYR